MRLRNVLPTIKFTCLGAFWYSRYHFCNQHKIIIFSLCRITGMNNFHWLTSAKITYDIFETQHIVSLEIFKTVFAFRLRKEILNADSEDKYWTQIAKRNTERRLRKEILNADCEKKYGTQIAKIKIQ